MLQNLAACYLYLQQTITKVKLHLLQIHESRISSANTLVLIDIQEMLFDLSNKYNRFLHLWRVSGTARGHYVWSLFDITNRPHYETFTLDDSSALDEYGVASDPGWLPENVVHRWWQHWAN